MTETGTPPQGSALRAARLRAVVTVVVTFVLAAGGYYACASTDLVADGCTHSSECPGFWGECLQAPTGSYCTRSCNSDSDCDPGTHCDTPPWENGATRTVCIHDSAQIRTH